MVIRRQHSEICPERPIVLGPSPGDRPRLERLQPEGSLSRLPPVLGLLYHNGVFLYHNEAAAGTLFTVRTGDERIAPESLTCPKSLFVHHNMSSKRAIEPLPIVKIPNHGRTVKPLCARRGQTQNAFPVNRQKLFLLREKGAN